MVTPRILRDNSLLETQIRPLIYAANTKTWKTALNILLINGKVLELSGSEKPYLIGIMGNTEDVERSIDLLRGESQTDIAPFLKSVMTLFMPKLFSVIEKRKDVLKNGEITESIKIAIITEFSSSFQGISEQMWKILVDSIFSFSKIGIIGAFISLDRFRGVHIHAAIDESDYEDMIEALNMLGLIEPKLQICLCPSCANYSFTLSNGPSFDKKCPNCGRDWVTLTLFAFDAPFSELKSQNLDLPIFVSAYLRHKVGMAAPISNFEIAPNVEMMIEEAGKTAKRAEIDVHIPQFETGIECKVFEDAFAPMTPSRIGSIIGGLVKQIKNYSEVGVKDMILISNVTSDSANTLKEALSSRLTKENVELNNLTFFGGTVDSFLTFLDELSTKFAESLNNTYENGMKKRIKSAIPKQGELDSPSTAS